MRPRALTRAALVAGLLLAASPAAATCVDRICTPFGPGSVDTSRDGSVSDSCLYYKHRAPAPADWPGYDNGGPYVFVRTKAWGEQPAFAWGVGWDYRVCDLLLSRIPTGG